MPKLRECESRGMVYVPRVERVALAKEARKKLAKAKKIEEARKQRILEAEAAAHMRMLEQTNPKLAAKTKKEIAKKKVVFPTWEIWEGNKRISVTSSF